MLKKIQIHSSSLETLLHTKAHLSQLTLTIRGANTMLWLNGSLGRSLMSSARVTESLALTDGSLC